MRLCYVRYGTADFFPIGGDSYGATATHELHAYSASGITDLDLQFDGLEWLLSDLVTLTGAAFLVGRRPSYRCNANASPFHV